MEPNPKQKQLIDNTDGIYLVDAGAGTGKTFTLTRRYANILSKPGVEPRDILLITFTNNAAEEMKERVINHCDYDALDLQEAPIATFHGLCNQLLFSDGFRAPQLLGIDNYITSSTRLIEQSELERPSFLEFVRGFKDRHEEYRDYLRLYTRPENLLDLIYALSAKGVFPTSDGWYQAGEDYLDGHLDRFEPILERENRPRAGSGNRMRQSALRKRLTGYNKKCFPPGVPSREEVRGDGQQANAELIRDAFREDRQGLKQFVHDLYHEYMAFALGRNYINFGFLMGLTYVALCERSGFRSRAQHSYVMVDEFQDTSEIQFKLSLLMASTNNICAVGDWKQSIYSFQYASVDNIRSFEKRINRYRDELNRGEKRVDYPVDDVKTIELIRNYRSTQSILDCSEKGLTLEATKEETLDASAISSDIVSLEAELDTEYGAIEGILSEDEPEAILRKISQIVDNPDFNVVEDGETRPIEFGDVAVLSRTRQFGLDLQEEARDLGIPVAYEGGVELFKTNASVVLLAWLRVLDDPRSREGWAVILQEAGYRHDEIKQRLNALSPVDNGEEATGKEPLEGTLCPDLLSFRRHLKQFDEMATVVRAVFQRYGFNDGFSDKIIDVLNRTFQETYMNLGEIIQFIQDNIESGATYEVDNRLEENTVTLQTIHAAKGLEYPVVFLADVNQSHFPSTGGGYPSPIQYRDPVGLRQKKLFVGNETPYQYDNWRAELLFKCLTGEYDEERRLMYVAMTRAEQYLFVTAEPDNRSQFFRGVAESVPVSTVEDPTIDYVHADREARDTLSVEPPTDSSPVKLSPHDLIDESVFEEVEGGLGTEFGSRVHRFAEDYVRGVVTSVDGLEEGELKEHAMTVKTYLDNKPGTLRAEKTCVLPVEVKGRQCLFEGVIDLIHETDEFVEIIDYKTDRSTEAKDEYRKQLSVYHHVLSAMYPDKTVRTTLYFVALDRELRVDPLTLSELADCVLQRNPGLGRPETVTQ